MPRVGAGNPIGIPNRMLTPLPAVSPVYMGSDLRDRTDSLVFGDRLKLVGRRRSCYSHAIH